MDSAAQLQQPEPRAPRPRALGPWLVDAGGWALGLAAAIWVAVGGCDVGPWGGGGRI